ncbi:MAG: type II secretion system F family protein [Deltaproteobacteria bacterium]|nr:type II secretion system F family protein [Deltaproteobacteria bacterium]
MPLYSYTATELPTGKTVNGELEADSQRTLRNLLRSKGLILVDCQEVTVKSKQELGFRFEIKKVGFSDLAIFTRQLSTLLDAGFQLVPAISKLSLVIKNKLLRSALVDIKEKLEQGLSFSSAVRQHPKIFPEFYVNMISAGERAGNLDTVFDNLASFLERQVDLTRRVVSSLFYPAIMLCLSFVVVVVLFTVVVPQIAEIFVKEGAKLPFVTRFILGISSFFSNYWIFLFIILAFVIFRINAIYRSQEGRKKIDNLLYNLSLLGDVLKKIELARFSLTLGSLLKGGVGVVSSIELATKVLNNSHFKETMLTILEEVKRGGNFSSALSNSGTFPDLFVSMITIGEQSGQLDRTLLKISEFYEKEATQTLQTIVNLIEPIMIIIIGLLVLVIVFAVITPIVDMINILKR